MNPRGLGSLNAPSPEIGTMVPLSRMSFQSKTGPPLASDSLLRYQKRSGPLQPVMLSGESRPGLGTSPAPAEAPLGAGDATKLTLQTRSLAPVFDRLSAREVLPRGGSTAARELGCTSTTGGSNPTPASGTTLSGCSGS